jgi:RNA polymerase sigma-70 factor (ECF subfamily)
MLTAEHERSILEACKQDPAQFGLLFDEYYTPIFGYILRRVGAYDEARDLTSETFLKAYLSIGKFTWRGLPFSCWLYRIATNEVNSHFRRKRRPILSYLDIRQKFLTEYPDPASLDTEREEIERQLEEHGMFLRVLAIVQEMSPMYQAVISLRYFERKSIQEIAGIVEKKEGTVKSMISRGLERIRSGLKVQAAQTK